MKGMRRAIKTSATAKASWPLIRTSSSAASNRSSSIVSSARSKVATGPTTDHPAALRIVSISPAIIASSSTISTRRPARRTRGFPWPGSARPAARRTSGFGLVGGPKGGWHDNAVHNSLHGLLLRIERYPQIEPQPAVFEFDLRLSAEAVADFALDQSQAETMPRRLANRRAAALDPVEYEALPAASFDRPGDFERSAGCR